MNVRVFENKEQLYREVADLYINELNSKKDLVLGLATGTTPIPLYQNLIKAYNEKIISFKNIRTFNLDEYTGIEKNHSASYYTFMREQLFNYVDIDLNNVNLPSGEGDVNLNKIAYQNLLKENIIDIQLLGLGSNGHIGFNEPGTSFDSLTHVIELAQKTREDNARLFNSIDEVPTHAITMGIKEIMNAKKIVVIATGLNKADAVYGMVKGDIVESLPASVLQNHKDVYVFIDKEAASKL